ncbi:hypothetical protein CDL12_26900 [Handroanthus impetiginosus]|uniref:BING4 C-terminal domain-containing protein n=1 Tax=Handroanthus impetiginosus TaxID=429701 RepID=A0A2G9G5L0_9LAMI|nr:hypothetical protein CDL12_26900 [Handroanthus impetiginosus]
MGEMVGNFRTGLGRSDTMQVNPFNNVVAVAHFGGTVTMWKPTSAAPLMKMLCQKGPITALAFHSNGHLMATAGMERKNKALGFEEILGDFSGPHDYSRYMGHSIGKGYQVRKVLFRPYEDVLGIRHSIEKQEGSSIPSRQTTPETIMLDPTKIGSVRPTKKKEKPTKQEREAEQEAAIYGAKNISFKKKTKGRSQPSKMAKKKQEAIAKAKKPFLEQQAKEEEMLKKKRKRNEEEVELPKSLQWFARKVPTT